MPRNGEVVNVFWSCLDQGNCEGENPQGRIEFGKSSRVQRDCKLDWMDPDTMDLSVFNFSYSEHHCI
jgi:hypothetical protein